MLALFHIMFLWLPSVLGSVFRFLACSLVGVGGDGKETERERGVGGEGKRQSRSGGSCNALGPPFTFEAFYSLA